MVRILGGGMAAFLFLTAWPAWGQSGRTGPEEPASLLLARYFLESGDFESARHEAERFIFFHPSHPSIPAAERLIEQIDSRPDLFADQNEAGSNPAVALVRFYQNRLRTFRSPGSECPSYPSCSAYTIEAVKKHGALMGTFIFVDRFWREATTAGTPPFVYNNGRKLHFDPLGYNDYWLSGPGKAEAP